jgi:regulator of protease activity HflC (stomatin/prohibitin superfamily)
MALLESGMLLFWPLIVIILIIGLLSFFTVQTAQVAVITRFGKFLRVAEPGLNWKWPFIDRVAGRVSLRVNQITLTMETKTKDNVFVTIPISVQNRVRPEKVYDAFYKLSDPMQQIQAYVEQVILGHVPGMTLDEVLITQYFDTIKSIGEMDKTNTLFLSHSPGAVRDISEQIMQSMLIADRAKS